MTKNSVKHPETWITVLLILATLIMMIASQLIGKPSHYFTFVALPTISVFFGCNTQELNTQHINDCG